ELSGVHRRLGVGAGPALLARGGPAEAIRRADPGVCRAPNGPGRQWRGGGPRGGRLRAEALGVRRGLGSYRRPMVLCHLLDRWRLAALVASAAMLAVAHGFQTFGGYQPCTLCLRQREVYWVAGAVGLAGMLLVRTSAGARMRQLTCWLLALVFL